MSVYQQLLKIRREKGAGFFILLDPDKSDPQTLIRWAGLGQEGGADALLIGSSQKPQADFDKVILGIKKETNLPIISFPGGPEQISGQADAILFLSLLSGRNPKYLIEDQVVGAPKIKALELEAISTGYLLIDSGQKSSVEITSGTNPLPPDDPEEVAAHALAGQYLGMKLIYLEAGSGAPRSVPETVIERVKSDISVPLIVGGGIREPGAAAAKVRAGADFVVIGNFLEMGATENTIREFARAIHQ